jgi:hypothetical protein
MTGLAAELPLGTQLHANLGINCLGPKTLNQPISLLEVQLLNELLKLCQETSFLCCV